MTFWLATAPTPARANAQRAATAGEDDVAGLEAAVLHQEVRDLALALLDLRLEHDAVRGAGRVALELEHLGLQEDALEQLYLSRCVTDTVTRDHLGEKETLPESVRVISHRVEEVIERFIDELVRDDGHEPLSEHVDRG